MIEVEIKIPVEDRNQIAAGLLHCGFTQGDLVQESDVYFNNDAFDLRKQDMALRVRSCENRTTGGTEAFLTYKGPKLDDRSMTRRELETAVGDAEVCMEIIRSLGYYSLKPVRKLRQYFHKVEAGIPFDKNSGGLQKCAEESCECGKMTACLDQVDGLGDFLELEMILEEPEEKQENTQEASMECRNQEAQEAAVGCRNQEAQEAAVGCRNQEAREAAVGCRNQEAREAAVGCRNQETREAALGQMDEVLEQLGLDRGRMTRTSYLSMLYGIRI